MQDSDRKPFSKNTHRRRRNQKRTTLLKRANANEIAELLSKKYGGINVFFALMIIFSLFILLTGIAIAKNVAEYRANYTLLQQMKTEQQLLKVEQQKLMIEQQAFSAIPKVASRAVSELDMYYPNIKDKIIIKKTLLNTDKLDIHYDESVKGAS